MSKTYRGWAEIEDWSHREVRRQHKRKAKKDWKKEVEEEVADYTVPVYVVRNFWTPAGEDFELSEDCHATFSEQEAWDVLSSLAEGRGANLGLNDTSFECPTDRHTQREYYAVIIMEVHNP